MIISQKLKLKQKISGPTTFTTTMCETENERKNTVVSDEEQSFKHYKLIF